MRLKTDRTAEQVRSMLAAQAEYVFYRGQIVGLEMTGNPRLAMYAALNADREIEGAAYEQGLVAFDAHPIMVDAIIVAEDGTEFPVKVWMDKAEAEQCSA